MTQTFLSIALLFLVTSAFTCSKVRDLKQINYESAETSLLKVRGWSIGENALVFDFALSPGDPQQREILKDPNLTRVQLSIGTASYKEDEASFLNGRRRTFSRERKEEIFVFSFNTNNTHQQIKKNNSPITLTVEAGDEKKTYTFSFK